MLPASLTRTFLLAGAATLLASCNPFEPAIYTACEEALKARLKSPASYKRTSIRMTEHDMDEIGYFVNQDLMDEKDRALRRKLWSRNPPKFINYAVTISYDAQNGFGALLRNKATCNYFSDDGTSERASQYSVKINGLSNLEWLRQSLSN